MDIGELANNWPAAREFFSQPYKELTGRGLDGVHVTYVPEVKTGVADYRSLGRLAAPGRIEVVEADAGDSFASYLQVNTLIHELGHVHSPLYNRIAFHAQEAAGEQAPRIVQAIYHMFEEAAEGQPPNVMAPILSLYAFCPLLDEATANMFALVLTDRLKEHRKQLHWIDYHSAEMSFIYPNSLNTNPGWLVIWSLLEENGYDCMVAYRLFQDGDPRKLIEPVVRHFEPLKKRDGPFFTRLADGWGLETLSDAEWKKDRKEAVRQAGGEKEFAEPWDMLWMEFAFLLPYFFAQLEVYGSLEGIYQHMDETLHLREMMEEMKRKGG